MKFIRREKLIHGIPVRDLIYDLCDDNGEVILKEDRYGFAAELAGAPLAAVKAPFRNSKVTIRPSHAGHKTGHQFKMVLRARLAEAQGAQSDVLELN
jgi:hypothetical protein